jgi:phenylacetate-CoA ligase
MHITAEDIVVELIDASGTPVPDGTPGEIVVTHLASRDFPFVRYRTGDMAVRDSAPCACGRGLPVLREIQGRSTDFVVAADGTVMHGLALIYVIRDLAGVQSFKIVQETRHSTSVQLVVDPTCDFAARRAEIVSGFKRRLGDAVEIKVERVTSIAPEASGKFRYVTSHVSESKTGHPVCAT